MNRFVSLFGVAIVCRWELGRTRTSWSILANVQLCLCLQRALLPQHMAVLIFSWTFAGHLTGPLFQHLFVKINTKFLYFPFPDEGLWLLSQVLFGKSKDWMSTLST